MCSDKLTELQMLLTLLLSLATCKAHIVSKITLHTTPHKMLTSSTNPLVFADTERLDGTDFATWELVIVIAVTSCSVLGYQQEALSNPAPHTFPTATSTYTPAPLEMPLPDDPTPWYSTNPSVTEWALLMGKTALGITSQQML